MKKKSKRARRPSHPVTRDLTFMAGGLLIVREGVTTIERLTRWERTVYPNGDIVTVMELA